MTNLILGIFIGLGLVMVVLAIYFLNKRDETKNKYVIATDIPENVIKSFRKRHTEFNENEIEIMVSGLVDFFNLKIFRDNKMERYKKKAEFKLDMPSETIDLLWHEFIIHTKEYFEFNKKFFKEFLNHTPYVDITINAKKKIENEMIDLIKYAIINDVIKSDTNLLYADEKILNKRNESYEIVKREVSDPVSLWSGIFLTTFVASYMEKPQYSKDKDSGGGDTSSVSSFSNLTNGDSDGDSSCGGCGD